MAEAVNIESVPARLTAIRENLALLDDYLDPALRERIGPYAPPATRNFFGIASHYEPITLFAHFQHWFDHAWLKNAPNPSVIRREAWLNNVWASRAEGTATARTRERKIRIMRADDAPGRAVRARNFSGPARFLAFSPRPAS